MHSVLDLTLSVTVSGEVPSLLINFLIVRQLHDRPNYCMMLHLLQSWAKSLQTELDLSAVFGSSSLKVTSSVGQQTLVSCDHGLLFIFPEDTCLLDPPTNPSCHPSSSCMCCPGDQGKSRSLQRCWAAVWTEPLRRHSNLVFLFQFKPLCFPSIWLRQQLGCLPVGLGSTQTGQSQCWKAGGSIWVSWWQVWLPLRYWGYLSIHLATSLGVVPVCECAGESNTH